MAVHHISVVANVVLIAYRKTGPRMSVKNGLT